MLKKILAAVLAVMTLLTLSACGGAAAVKLPELTLETTPAENSGEEAKVVRNKPDGAKYEKDLKGLCGYMEAGQAVVKDDTDNSFTEMSYQEIGAKGGFRYRFTYNKTTVQAEFYEFDPENLNEKGRTCIAEAGETGKITVLDKQVPVTLHPSGRFLMIYTDSKAEGKKADQKSLDQKAWVEELFLSFSAS